MRCMQSNSIAALSPLRPVAAAQSADTLDVYRANTDEAISLGVVGSPTFMVGPEMFFGQDRMDFVREALQA